MININKLSRSYRLGQQEHIVLNKLDLRIEKGSFVAVLGRSGCGKSTLVKHINAILTPQSGSVSVDGMDTRDKSHIYDIRQKAGMVFQDPDSQAVASIVEDDVAFAPENLGLDEEEIKNRVEFALDAAGISGLRNKSISTLSGGQKQLTAIAGILAMCPEYMIFDESTSMLDPAARKRVIDRVMRLRDELGIAVIWITHYMDEAVKADRVVIINKGSVAADGTPEDVFADTELIRECGLELPPAAELCLRLMRADCPIPRLALDIDDFADMLSGALAAAQEQREVINDRA